MKYLVIGLGVVALGAVIALLVSILDAVVECAIEAQNERNTNPVNVTTTASPNGPRPLKRGRAKMPYEKNPRHNPALPPAPCYASPNANRP